MPGSFQRASLKSFTLPTYSPHRHGRAAEGNWPSDDQDPEAGSTAGPCQVMPCHAHFNLPHTLSILRIRHHPFPHKPQERLPNKLPMFWVVCFFGPPQAVLTQDQSWWARGTIWGGRDGTWVRCMQGKQTTCCAQIPFPYFRQFLNKYYF